MANYSKAASSATIQKPQLNMNGVYKQNGEKCKVEPIWFEKPDRNVLLYIDNSNIFECTKKHSGQLKRYVNDLPDVCCRVDIGKLIAIAKGNHELLRVRLYGSEPPPLDTVWQAFRQHNIDVQTFKRSTYTLKEKETDTTLTADAVDDIISDKDEAGDNPTVILFSGDRDLISVVKKGIKYGYNVEVWGFRKYINHSVRMIAQDETGKGSVVIKHIDDIFEIVTFTTYFYNKRGFPPERSLVATVKLPKNCDKDRELKDFVLMACDTFRMSMVGAYRGKQSEYIILVPCHEERYKPRAKQGSSNGNDMCIKNYDYVKDIAGNINKLMTRSKICKDVKTWFEFNSSRGLIINLDIPLSDRFDKLKATDDNDNDDDDDETFYDAQSNFDQCEFLETLSQTYDYFESRVEDLSDGAEEEEEEFTLVAPKQRKEPRMYSTPCNYKFSCGKGLKCSYKHSPKEQEFFKLQTDPKRRRLYKTIVCHHMNPACRYMSKPYLCSYAHNLEESRCLACKQKGNGKHWMDTCPSLKRK